eukprot:COSAG05_NODE_594_length_8461_cov_4.373475_2_plen_233_part_00
MLAAARLSLIRVLQHHPVLPLFANPMQLSCSEEEDSDDWDFWARVLHTHHVGTSNRGQIDEFITCLQTFAPTTPCVSTHQLTVHQILRPPLLITVDPWASAAKLRCVAWPAKESLSSSLSAAAVGRARGSDGGARPGCCLMSGADPPEQISNRIPLALGQCLAEGEVQLLVNNPDGTQSVEQEPIWELLCWRHSSTLTTLGLVDGINVEEEAAVATDGTAAVIQESVDDLAD